MGKAATSGRGAPGGEPPTPFTVLLGPDYAGKSSVLTRLARRTNWTVISYDEELLGPGYPLIGELRDGFLSEALRGMGERYSSDFLLTLLQAAVVHLRDRALAAPAGRPAIVDSYYYKILAKCVLAGHANDAVFTWWRSFPQPARVVYLDISPETGWRRSGHGSAANPLEHYGDRPTRQGFTRFQADLRRLMLGELGEVPGIEVDTVREGGDVEETARAVQQLVGRGIGNAFAGSGAGVAIPA